MPITKEAILTACQTAWEGEWAVGHINKNNCSGFVKAVAHTLGAKFDTYANADQMVEFMTTSGSWKSVTDGTNAQARAANGFLVLAGLKSSAHTPAKNNGHVVVIIEGPLYRNIYPLCWGGSIGSAQSNGNKSVGEVWNQTDRNNVKYFEYLESTVPGG